MSYAKLLKDKNEKIKWEIHKLEQKLLVENDHPKFVREEYALCFIIDSDGGLLIESDDTKMTYADAVLMAKFLNKHYLEEEK